MRALNTILTWIDPEDDTISLIRWASVSFAATLIIMGVVSLAQYVFEHLLG